MITCSIIQKLELEGAHRMDAEYYQPEFLELDKKIKRFENYLLGDLIISFASGKNLPQADFCNSNIFFIRTQNVRPVLIDKDGMTCVDPYVKKYPSLKEGDILTVRVGEGVGNTSIATPEFEGHSYSDNVIRFRIKNIDPYFLIVFLNSKYGYDYLERVSKGSARPLISSENIHSIRVPNLGKEVAKFCKEQIFEATTEIQKSEFLYSQAEDLLLEELGLKKFKPEENLSCVVNLSEVKLVHRTDAEYFQPKYEKLISKIKNQNAKPLMEMIDNIPARFNPSTQPERIFKYVELANINTSVGTIDGFSEVSGREAPSRAKRVLKNGDVIVSTVEGSLEKVALVDKEQEGYLASTGFFQFRSKEILPEMLVVLAKSIVLQMQLKRQTAGTILTAVPKEAIKNILLPILPKSTQQKIADLVRQSHESRKRAKQLLAEAKRKVEEMIEKGGKHYD